MIPKIALLTAAAALLGASSSKVSTLDEVARDYVRLALEVGERDPGYVDAYYGPPAWAAAAKASPRTVAQLRADAHALRLSAEGVPVTRLTAIERQRRTFLIGQLKAAETRMAMIAGQKFTFEDEAEGLFGVRPSLAPLASFDATLAEVDRLVPGDGPLWQRVEAYNDRFTVPPAKLDAVMRAAISECRRRTMAHIALPAAESFELEFVTGKSWSAYNYYKGNSGSLIQVNTDQPMRIDQAIGNGCHEGYPGHHVYNVLLERNLARGRGWIEFTVYPLYSPQSLIAEGSANFGVDLAFPGQERAAFEAKTLFPLAGFDPAEAPRFVELKRATQKLAGARLAIFRDYLDGRIDRTRAEALIQSYGLTSADRAKQWVDFADQYRSYVINYGVGQDMVEHHVTSAAPDVDARWREMERILSQPTTPADLQR